MDTTENKMDFSDNKPEDKSNGKKVRKERSGNSRRAEKDSPNGTEHLERGETVDTHLQADLYLLILAYGNMVAHYNGKWIGQPLKFKRVMLEMCDRAYTMTIKPNK